MTKKTVAMKFNQPKNAGLARLIVVALLFVGFASVDAVAQEGQVTETPENLARVEYNKGLELVRAERFQEALRHFNQGIELDPSNPRNYYMKALATRRLGNEESAIETFLKSAEVAERAGDARLAQMSTDAAARGHMAMGARALQAERAREALTHLNRAVEIADPDADTHFYFARALNATGQYEQAVTHAQQGIEKESGGRNALAKFYFELGMAYKNLGDVSNARSAFEQAAVGQYRRAAEYELEHLR